MTRLLIGFLVTLTLSLLVAPLAAEAPPATHMSRIGWLSPGVPRPDHDPPVDAFRQGLREFGYVEGQHLVMMYRGAEGRIEQLPALAAELVQLQVDVIVTLGENAVTRTAQTVTRTIPIVMVSTLDPVGQGFIASLARPGGNTTGTATLVIEPAWARRTHSRSPIVPDHRRPEGTWEGEAIPVVPPVCRRGRGLDRCTIAGRQQGSPRDGSSGPWHVLIIGSPHRTC
jgi:putative tryptophan/tyrosine transport system substrate-binding protein